MNLENSNEAKLLWTKPELLILNFSNTKSGDYTPEEFGSTWGPS